jgi:pimeloyl-ACP methyl ester carboxylesterase
MAQASPIETEEVSWPLGETTVYGTLVRPAGAGPFPGVVFVAGSGPTDRDWNTPLLPGTNGSARLLAEALAAAGYASLRYDKRASGPHARENMAALVGKISLQGHIDELAGAVRRLAESDGVDPKRLFALTNSEGAVHALNYQIHNPAIPFGGLILTAPPGRPIGVIARSQLAAQLLPLPGGDAMMAQYDTAIERFLAGQPADPDPSLPEGVKMLLSSLENPANQPFSRELWMTDTTGWLAQVSVPVLVVVGQKDLQVDWQADVPPMRKAVEGRDNVTFAILPNANHVLKYEPEPRAALSPAAVGARYNAEDAYLDPEVLSAIVGWLADQRA